MGEAQESCMAGSMLFAAVCIKLVLVNPSQLSDEYCMRSAAGLDAYTAYCRQ